jgi:ribosomal protein L16 Arg81 hydroxylase
LTDALSHDVGVNVYFTPPSAQGFSAHADGHDVFLLQIAGRKSWRVYPPVIRLPLEDQHVPVEAEDLRVCLLEATVEPGHVLYIPRGFLHEGLAEDRASFHLTIGIHPVRMADIVQEAVEIAAERDERLRESVPLQAFAHGSFSPQLATKLVEILAALGQADVAQETLTLLGERKVADSRPAPDSHFAAIDAARSLGLNTVVRRRHGLDCTVRSADGRATIDFGFNSVVGPDSIREALGYISSNVEFRVAELPDELSDQSKIVLARRLIHEGLLTTNGRPNSKGAR